MCWKQQTDKEKSDSLFENCVSRFTRIGTREKEKIKWTINRKKENRFSSPLRTRKKKEKKLLVWGTIITPIWRTAVDLISSFGVSHKRPIVLTSSRRTLYRIRNLCNRSPEQICRQTLPPTISHHSTTVGTLTTNWTTEHKDFLFRNPPSSQNSRHENCCDSHPIES